MEDPGSTVDECTTISVLDLTGLDSTDQALTGLCAGSACDLKVPLVILPGGSRDSVATNQWTYNVIHLGSLERK